MSNSILSQDHLLDKITFTLRGWLNWAVILWGIVKLHLRRWPVTWAIDVLATVLATVLLVPAWAAYRLGALVGATVSQISRFLRDSCIEFQGNDSQIFRKKAVEFQGNDSAILRSSEPYATIPVSAGLVLEIRTEPPALWIRKDGAALEVEPGELMALAGALTVAAGGLPELMKTRGILWEG